MLIHLVLDENEDSMSCTLKIVHDKKYHVIRPTCRTNTEKPISEQQRDYPIDFCGVGIYISLLVKTLFPNRFSWRKLRILMASTFMLLSFTSGVDYALSRFFKGKLVLMPSVFNCFPLDILSQADLYSEPHNSSILFTFIVLYLLASLLRA